jgi:hypothetical protein
MVLPPNITIEHFTAFVNNFLDNYYLVEIWEYRKHNWADGSLAEAYWLYFLNDRLEQWGRPGDWSKEADRIYEVRFR